MLILAQSKYINQSETKQRKETNDAWYRLRLGTLTLPLVTKRPKKWSLVGGSTVAKFFINVHIIVQSQSLKPALLSFFLAPFSLGGAWFLKQSDQIGRDQVYIPRTFYVLPLNRGDAGGRWSGKKNTYPAFGLIFYFLAR